MFCLESFKYLSVSNSCKLTSFNYILLYESLLLLLLLLLLLVMLVSHFVVPDQNLILK